MITKIAFLFVLVGISESGINCPKQFWTPLKNDTEEGSWSFSIPTQYATSITMVHVKMYKSMSYRCRNENAVELSASLHFQYSREDRGKIEQKLNFTTSVETCKLGCNTTASIIGFCSLECISDVEVPLTVEVRHSRRMIGGSNREWRQWEETGQFTYLYKNCNKLYWSSWTETSNCTSSAQTTFARSCVDCDGDGVQPKYCKGNFTKQTQCQPIWGPWGEAGPCKVSLCNSTGEQVRSRLCLYGDGSQSSDTRLCSNQSSTMKQQCAWDRKQQAAACQQAQSEEGGESNNTSVYVGIGIAVLLILVLGLGLTAVRRRRHQKIQTNYESHRDQFAVVSADAEPSKQFRSRSKRYNRDQLDIRNSAVLHEYKVEQPPCTSRDYEVVQPSDSAVYDFAEPVGPNAYEFEQPTVSQPAESIENKLKNSSAKLKPSYSTIQGHRNVTKHNDIYHNLRKKASSPSESEYSTLSSR